MTNLFSIFDPATSTFLSMNWVSFLLFIFFFPYKMWLVPSRYSASMIYLIEYLFKQFSPITKKMQYILITSVTYFIFIMFNNVMGLFPYVFTASSHMVFTLSLALMSWLALMLYGWLNNSSNLLVHMIPQGTPYVLMPFMVIIETISNLIRPGTLAVRLAANMIAGHLLMVLLSNALASSSLYIFSFVFTAQMALTLLESAVSFIQAYVFSVLITLYMDEFAN
uniref:ATP synthase subunit a n=1 Tax=Platorchestia parapacifica TaxID=1395100 RepID=A0A343SA06_9CRUS|nr:ATP synthase F0 subunit 6 [Platorchestia parapacifica]